MQDMGEILMNTDELYDPIFVVGCQRSGTTVLGRTIGLAENVCYLGETKLISHYYTAMSPLSLVLRQRLIGQSLARFVTLKITARLKGECKYILAQTVTNLVKLLKLQSYTVAPGPNLLKVNDFQLADHDIKLINALCRKYEDIRRRDFHRMLRVLFKDFQLLSAKARLIDKTPLHVFYIPAIRNIFPEAKLCHIIRDGKDVAASYLLNYGQPKSDIKSIRYICRVHARALLIDEALRRTNEPNYCSLRYEELISQPAPVIRRLFAFLDLPFSDSVLTALQDIKPTPSNWSRLPAVQQRRVADYLRLAHV